MTFDPKIGDRIKAISEGKEYTGEIIGIEYNLSARQKVGVLLLFDDLTVNLGVKVSSSLINFWDSLGPDQVLLAYKIYDYLGRKVFWFDINVCKLLTENKSVRNTFLQFDGAFCIKCHEFAPYANEGFTCFSCKTDPYRFSKIITDDI